ncbi:MAG TPA: transcription-repair coupling factor, partial [Saprospiraceae bacterium]|nr:transcription-repair coupling factor [Saprospiraceae bacterium]
AAYLHNTISSLLPDADVLFLPDSFKRPGLVEEIISSQVMERTDAINKLYQNGLIGHAKANMLIVTYTEAMIESVISPASVTKQQIEIKKGENLDVDGMLALMIDIGFERVDFVYEPGQFSIRGGIIDIFSFGNEWPYRIELFDEEVESIRLFDPLTQLSQRNLSVVHIIPNVQTHFESEEYIPVMDAIPAGTRIWIQEPQLIIDRFQDYFEKLSSISTIDLNTEQVAVHRFIKEKKFTPTHKLIHFLKNMHVVSEGDESDLLKPAQKVQFSMKSQPSFNKNFNLLIDDLKRQSKLGKTNYIFTANARQVERFYSIFEDLGAKVQFIPITKSIHEGFIDDSAKVVCYTDHQVFERFHAYQLRKGFSKDQALNVKMLRELQPGDFVTHIDHGIGKYSGLEKITIGGHVQESVRLFYKNNDILYVSIHSLHKISKFVGKDGTEPVLSKLGSDAWENLKRKTKSKVKDIARELIKLYALRKSAPGFAFAPDGYLQTELEASFIYEDTPDQFKATQDVKEDMEQPHPMDRLICGDVGFGKTEVAIRAAFKAVENGKQVAVLVPTTILALQHQQSFTDRVGPLGVSVDYINRFRSTKEKREIMERLKEGKLDVVIGTHAILNKEMEFKDLGLLIVDEEQKFGVSSKEKLRKLKVNVDTLTLTATPIPRTLQFSLMAARDLSIIRTPPPNRQPIHTERRVFSEELIRDAIYYEVNRGGQVFFVHNRIKSLPEVTALIKRICPDIDVVQAHGQMEADQLEETLLDFINRKHDVLVCTNIIETGLDIPNANTIIINHANQFGLSDLHQLRGRVGRSNKKAFCYLIAPPLSALTQEARKRLQTIEEYSDLGSGFDIAMRDLDIRGAGNLLGAEQSGFISDIGYETYQKILEEAIQELKESDFKDLFKEQMERERKYVQDVQIDSDVEMLIPDEYVSNIDERLRLYTALDHIETEEDIDKFASALADRFGPVPAVVEELFEGLRLRWVAKILGFDRITLRGFVLRCYFHKNAQSAYYESQIFDKLIKILGTQGRVLDVQLKQSSTRLLMIKEKIRSMRHAREFLSSLLSLTEKEMS